MIHQSTLTNYLRELLSPDAVPDYTVNGLQVEGRKNISRMVTGVTACQPLLDQAIDNGADAVLVHHGYFWKNEPPAIVGPKKQRLQKLLTHEINLYAYHLPLDIHETYGNNIQLANKLGWRHQRTVEVERGLPLLNIGYIKEPASIEHFTGLVEQDLGHKPLLITGNDHPVQSIAWCSGAGQDFIELAAAEGADVYVTGEVSERTVHLARELNLHFIAAGHHATERDGVAALGNHLAKRFGLECEFIDIENPV